jgi:hypothetical protein
MVVKHVQTDATMALQQPLSWDPGGYSYWASEVTSLWLHRKDVVSWNWKCGDSVGTDFKLKIKKELIMIVFYWWWSLFLIQFYHRVVDDP